ncbi:hypothetical protein CHS0354_029734 [Potamilus streckersoni]|uniref:Heat shock 70 kDa protein 12A n=1 Tax=Potamilus streckersoni TaxID=2493646 RepID=A0AAE0WDJ6_9BIVA|nr:hypothetical protein CHS0354_029734 [Potamilus streckersoni]
MAKRWADALLVVAIDFGTTYSGYAFQFKHDFANDPTKISAPQAWNGGKKNLMSMKTPTILLLNEKKEIESFGFEAEDRYSNFCMDGTNEKYYYFRRFKMKLQDEEGLKKTSMIEDETGKKMAAIDVFSLSIRSLKNHLTQMLEKQGTGVRDTEIHWVLTVPAIWSDAAKQFMRQAAEKAGIPSNQLCIALEPEAASMFCQYLPVDKFCTQVGDVQFSASPPGTKYMVVDLGGGTADMTIHEKLQGGGLKEVCKASGGPWGGTAVDMTFLQLLVSIVSGPVMHKFMKTQVYDYLDLFREFESAKRNLSLETKDKINLKFPASLNEICREMTGNDFKTCVTESVHSSNVTIMSDKMRINPDLMRSLFRKVTDNIIRHVKSMLSQGAGKEVTLILMVGGFSESPFVQDVMRGEFHNKNGLKVIIPKEAGISVMNGAVIFGRNPETIQSRVLRYTYGVEILPNFEEGKHPESKKVIVSGIARCVGVFSPFITMDTEVERGHKVIQVYNTTSEYQREANLAVYTSKEKEPKFITDPGCQFLGDLNIIIPNPTKQRRNFVAAFIFGETEISVLVLEEDSEIPFVTAFKMIE